MVQRICVAYTNASTIINSKFNFDDVTGLFNGWDPATRSYSKEPDSWDYEYEMNPDGSRGAPKTDPTLQDPHCVFQLLKKQVEKYTPEASANICGCRPCDIVKVAELLAQNSGPTEPRRSATPQALLSIRPALKSSEPAPFFKRCSATSDAPAEAFLPFADTLTFKALPIFRHYLPICRITFRCRKLRKAMPR